MSLTIGLKANITYSLFLLKHGALRHIVWTYMQEVDWYKMDKMFGVKHSEILKWFESKIQYKMSQDKAGSIYQRSEISSNPEC